MRLMVHRAPTNSALPLDPTSLELIEVGAAVEEGGIGARVHEAAGGACGADPLWLGELLFDLTVHQGLATLEPNYILAKLPLLLQRADQRIVIRQHPLRTEQVEVGAERRRRWFIPADLLCSYLLAACKEKRPEHDAGNAAVPHDFAPNRSRCGSFSVHRFPYHSILLVSRGNGHF